MAVAANSLLITSLAGWNYTCCPAHVSTPAARYALLELQQDTQGDWIPTAQLWRGICASGKFKVEKAASFDADAIFRTLSVDYLTQALLRVAHLQSKHDQAVAIIQAIEEGNAAAQSQEGKA